MNWWLLEKPMSSFGANEDGAVSGNLLVWWRLLEKPVSSLSFGELAAFKKPACWVAALEPMKMEQYWETFW